MILLLIILALILAVYAVYATRAIQAQDVTIRMLQDDDEPNINALGIDEGSWL